MLLLSLLFLASFPRSGLAAPTDSPSKASYLVQGEDAGNVIRQVLEASGCAYTLDGDIRGPVYLNLPNVTPERFLDAVCTAKGYHWWKDGQAYIVSSRTQAAAAVSAPPAPKPVPDDARATRKVFRRLDLHNTDVQDILYRLGYARGPRSSQLEALLPQPVTFVFGQAPEERGRVGSSSQPESPVGSLREYYDNQTPAGPTQVTAPTPGGYAQLQNLLPPGMDPPVAIENLNALLLSGTEEAIEKFIEIVQLLDKKPQQVLIEVQFISVNESDARALGINWAWTTGDFLFSLGGFAPAGNVNIQYTRGNRDFAATMSTLLTERRARVVNAARLATTQNMPATITQSTQTPFVTFGSTVGELGQVTSTARVDLFGVVTSLVIIPRVNGDNSVTTYLTPIITDIIGSVNIPTTTGTTQELPIVSTKSLSTLMTVRDGETVVIGGFITKDESVSRIKVPLLSELPIIGPLLFTRTDRSHSNNELLIFVTPHVLRDEETPVTLGPSMPGAY
jgi:hypothetical protein